MTSTGLSTPILRRRYATISCTGTGGGSNVSPLLMARLRSAEWYLPGLRGQHQMSDTRTHEPSPWDRWVDPDLVVAVESGAKATRRLRAELAAARDAAIAQFGPIGDTP